jgi:ATP-dependent DNA helicase RecG
LDQFEINGDLIAILRAMELRAETHSRHVLVQKTAFQERLQSDYPILALRELFVNALIHRDYQSNMPTKFYWFEDRIELSNAGSLYGNVSPQNFMRVTGYRNPVLAESFKALGFVNRYGYGLTKVQGVLHNNGNPPAHLEPLETVFFATVYPCQTENHDQFRLL